jgi:hypothetical protein
MTAEEKDNPKSTNVFISYCRDDSGAAEILSKHLAKYYEEKGTKIFLDKPDIEFGDSWRDGIEQSIRKSNTFLILVSNAARSSEVCSTEWSAICERKWTEPNVRVIPILVDEAEIPAFLGNLRTLDGRDSNRLVACASKIADYPAVAADPVKFDSLPKELREGMKERLRALLNALPFQKPHPHNSPKAKS